MPQLHNPLALSLKAGVGVTLALLICQVTNVPDGLSAAFVAVICTTPTVLAGLRRASSQAVASVIGGGLAAVVSLVDLPMSLSIGVAVTSSVALTFALGFGAGHLVAAFTAIYMYIAPVGDPGTTLVVRIAAVCIGGASAMVVNTLASAMFYRSIFARRLDRAEQQLATLFESACHGGPDAMLPIFPVLAGLTSELAHAERELAWRGSAVRESVRRLQQRVRVLSRAAHFGRDLGLTVDQAGASLTDIDRALLGHAAAKLRGEQDQAPTGLGEVGARLLAALQRHDALDEDDGVERG
jgi:hypothetical protein